MNDLFGQAKSLSKLAMLSLDENQLDEVVGYGEAALAKFGRVHVDLNGTADTLCALATAHLRRGEHSTAISMARDAVRKYQGVGNSSGRVDALVLLGRALVAAGESAEAARTLAMAELVLPAADPRSAVIRALADSVAERPVPVQRTEDSVGGHAPRTHGAVEDELTEGAS